MTKDCENCIHERICVIWRANECQDASCYIEDCYEPAADNWIPVSEALPEEYTEVLITYVEQGVGAPITVTGELDSNGNWYSEEIGSIWDDEVTAWQPLPEPYKGVEK